MGGERLDLLPPVADAAGGRWQVAAEDVDEGGLAGAVRADKAVDVALLDRERDAVQRPDAAEGAVYVVKF